MPVSIILPTNVTGQVGIPVHINAQITGARNITWRASPQVLFTISLNHQSINFTPQRPGIYQFQVIADGTSRVVTVNVGGIAPTPSPTPTPTPTPGPVQGLMYDSHVNSLLHNGQVRRFVVEGNLECRASGNPYIQVNNDGTFSLWDSDLGRFYLHVNNYDVMLEIIFAFGQGNQNASFKLRSRHNEGDPITNRFGGYGFDMNRTSCGGKREPYHNAHDESVNGSSFPNLGTGVYHTLQFSVKDINGKPTQAAVLDGRRIWSSVDNNPQPYMLNRPLYAQRSYIWVRQNTTSLTELRIKSLKLYAI